MFDTAGGMELTGIRIVNPKVSGDGPVGALANTAQSAAINDCRVYAAVLNGDGTSNFTALEKDFTVTGDGGTAGGLIGSAAGCTIKDSFAALSGVDGTVAGGLIGSADGCAIENCYATAENLSGGTSAMFIGSMNGGTVTRCYAAGNIASTGGTVSGFANGSGTFADSYCAVSYNNEAGNPVEPVHGFAGGSGSNCAYLNVTTPTGTDAAQGMSYEELANPRGSGWQALSPAQTRPYRQRLDGMAYPFPGLAMPHYGSWPTHLKLFDAASGGNELRIILIPADGVATVWAETSGGVSVKVKGPRDSSVIGGLVPEQDGKRTKITVTAAPGRTGATYIDLESGENQLRAVVVVYTVTVTLTGTNPDTGATAAGTANQAGDTETGQLSLKAGALTGTFTAAAVPEPAKDEVLSELAAMRSDLGQEDTLSAGEQDFAGWEALLYGDPSVTINGDSLTGIHYLDPDHVQADDGGTLTVTGIATGTAEVSARWAMDEAIEAKCRVKVEGTRALIQAVSATGQNNNAPLGEKDNYPYYLDVRAEPNEEIQFSFTPKLFLDSGTEGEYHYFWEISDKSMDKRITGDTTDSLPEGETYPNENAGKWTPTLPGGTGWKDYIVNLWYGNDDVKLSVDSMTFSVYCAAKMQKTNYSTINIEQSDGQGFLTGDGSSANPYRASVEQINGGTGYEQTAELELQSWVEGANNTRVKWSYSTDGGGSWAEVTGSLGSVSIYETKNGVRRPRATVQWMNEKQTYTPKSSVNEVSTGGAVRIEALDANEYDEPFSFQLRAAAVDALENGDAVAAYQTVDVTVMNRLQINPQSYTGYQGGNITLSANRTDRTETGWAYDWQINSTGNTTFPGSAADRTEITFRVNAEGERRVTLQYGPHIETAVLQTVGSAHDLLTTINWDAQWEGSDYFLVEKGSSRRMTNSWYVGAWLDLYRAKMATEPSNNSSTAAITPLSVTGSTGVGDVVETGQRYYTVTGKEFCDPQDMTWRYNHGTVWAWDKDSFVLGRNPHPTDYTVKLAVVGMDLTWPGKADTDASVSLPNPGAVTSLTADWHFPLALIRDGTQPEITWTVDHPDMILFRTDAAGEAGTATGREVDIVAKKYSAVDYGAVITATCTIQCVNGREYTYKKHIPVVVSSDDVRVTDVTVDPCTAGDLDKGLGEAFMGDHLDDKSLLAAVDENNTPVLIQNRAFGCYTLYLKVRASLSNGGDANLEDYFCNLSIDRSFVDIATALDPNDSTTMYVRLRAKEPDSTAQGTADLYQLELSAAIGDAVRAKRIDLYDHPGVALTRIVEENGKEKSEVVTNGSIPVYLDQTDLSVTLRATLVPLLHRAGETTLLDRIDWTLKAPGEYKPSEYLTLNTFREEPDKATVSIDSMPDFRVEVHARSSRSDVSDAGYALVFLPVKEGEEDTP